MNNNFFWGNPDASIHFCENKYDKNIWIAEYYNSISAFCYIIVAFYLYSKEKYIIGDDLLFLGISTFLFHMSLRSWAQILDETSMIVLSYDVIQHVTKIKRIFIYPILVTYLIFHKYFIFFLMIFASMQIYLTKIGLKLTKGTKRMYLYLYIVFFILGFVCWIIDQFACEKENNINYHFLWHNLSALAIFFGLLAVE